MKFSLKKFSSEWQSVFDQVSTRTSWIDDLRRGVNAVLTGSAFIVDRTYSEGELIRLRYQLDKVEEKLSQAYQALGKKGMAHWHHHQELDEKEKKKLLSKVETICVEKERLLEQMTATKTLSSSEPPPPSTSVSEEQSK